MTMHPDDKEKQGTEETAAPEAEATKAPDAVEGTIEFDAEAEEEMLRRLRAMGYVE